MVRKMLNNDIEELILLHKDAFDKSINLLAGDVYLYHMFKWFIDDSRISLVSFDANGTITGYVFGAELGYDKEFNRYIWIYAMRGLLNSPLNLLNLNLISNIRKRILSILSFSRNISKKTNQIYKGLGFSLVGIAVHPKYKGTIYSAELIEAFEEYAKIKGANYLRLSVHKDNLRAQNFYLKHLWVEQIDNSCLYYYKKIDLF